MSNVTPSNVSANSKNTLETHDLKPISKPKQKQTWIPFSPTPLEYQKLGLNVPFFVEDVRRDTKTRLVKENYTRKINAIYWVRTDDDKEWLNWHETREGKSPMQRKTSFDVPNMGKKKVPIPNEDIQFDLENEEYNTVVTGEKEHRLEYFIPYTIDNVNELLEDINPYRTSCHIKHEGQRTFSITKEELKSKEGFARLYQSKSSAGVKK